MHGSLLDFATRMRAIYPTAFRQVKVFEGGSYNINGEIRQIFFAPAEYVGVDWREGPGVTDVSLIHEFRGKPNAYFDTVVSTSLLEHDPYWRLSIARMSALARVGGSLLITCASPTFPPHEITTAPEQGYYKGLSAEEVATEILKHARWESVLVEENLEFHDIYVFAHNKIAQKGGL